MSQLVEEFAQTFGGPVRGVRIFFAPGRVNLIGEHIDYNGGHVLPCALDLGTYVAARLREDRVVRLSSRNDAVRGSVQLKLDSMRPDPADGWVNYPKGIIAELNKRVGLSSGLELLFWGDLPREVGLSSSASIELATAVAVDGLCSLHLDRVELVRLAQQVERDYAGVSCGIMDQFAAGMCRRDHAVLLDCESLDYEHIPLRLGDCSLVIANTNRRRGLARSAYNQRRGTCERALRTLRRYLHLPSLARLTPEQFGRLNGVLTPVEARRAQHVVEEQQRTILGATLLKQGNLIEFGQLMRESHISLRDLYDVTGPELDALAEAAWEHEGTIGARMTGAGFGGCTVNIVRTGCLQSFVDEVGRTFLQRTGRAASFYMAGTANGAAEIEADRITLAGKESVR